MADNGTDPDVTFIGEEPPLSSLGDAKSRSRTGSESSVKSTTLDVGASGKTSNPTCSNLNKRLRGVESLLKEVENAGLAAELLTKVRAEFGLLQVKIDHLTASNLELHSAKQCCEALTKQASDLKTSNGSLELQVGQLTSEVAQLQQLNGHLDVENRSLCQCDGTQKMQILGMEEQLGEHVRKLTEKDLEIAELHSKVRKHAETISAYEAIFDEHRGKILKLEGELSTQSHLVTSLRAQLDEQSKSPPASLTQQIEELLKERGSCRTGAETAATQLRELTEELDRHKSKLTQSTSAKDQQFDDLLNELTKIRSDLAVSQSETTKFQEEAKQSRSELVRLQIQANAIDREAKSEKLVRQQIEVQISGLQRQIDELQAQSNFDKDRLQRQKEQIDTLTAELNSIPLPAEMEQIVREKQREEFRLTREAFDREGAELDERERICDEREREVAHREVLSGPVSTPHPAASVGTKSDVNGHSRVAQSWTQYAATDVQLLVSGSQHKEAGDGRAVPRMTVEDVFASQVRASGSDTTPAGVPPSVPMDPHVAAVLEIARLAVSNSRPADPHLAASSKIPASSDLRDILRFDGSKKPDQLNIYSFFDNVDVHKRVKKWDDSTAAGVLNLVFEGEARAKFEALDQSVRDSYALAKQKMIDLYSTETTRLSFQSQFHSRNQKITETWDAYLIDLKSIARQAFLGSKEDIEKIVFPRFMSGLSQDARIFIRPYNPMSLERVVTALQEYDAAKGVDPPSSTAPPRLAAASARANNSSSFATRLQQLNDNRQASGTVLACYNCGRPGHFSNQCRAPRRQSNSQQQPAPFQHQRTDNAQQWRFAQNDSSQQQNRPDNRVGRQRRDNRYRGRNFDENRRGAGVFGHSPVNMDGSSAQQTQNSQHSANSSQQQASSATQPSGQGNGPSGASAQSSMMRRD